MFLIVLSRMWATEATPCAMFISWWSYVLLTFRSWSQHVENVITLCSDRDAATRFETKQHGLKWNGMETFQLWNVSMQKVKVFQSDLLMKRDPFWLILFGMSWYYKRSTRPRNSLSQVPSLALRPTFEKAFQSVSSVLKRLFQRWSLDGFLVF